MDKVKQRMATRRVNCEWQTSIELSGVQLRVLVLADVLKTSLILFFDWTTYKYCRRRNLKRHLRRSELDWAAPSFTNRYAPTHEGVSHCLLFWRGKRAAANMAVSLRRRAENVKRGQDVRFWAASQTAGQTTYKPIYKVIQAFINKWAQKRITLRLIPL